MKPKVVILSAFLTPLRSGAEACVEEVAPLLSKDYAITIITARMKRELPVHDHLGDISVIRVGFGCGFDKWLFPFLSAFAAKKIKPRIIHAVLESFAGLGLVVCAWVCPRAKRILTCQSTNTSLLLRSMHRSAHHITAISSVLMERARRFGRNDATLIRNGIRLKEITQAVAKETRVAGRILFVGRLEPMKGVATLLDAYAEIAHEFPKAHLHIIGDGSLRHALQERHSTLVDAQRIIFRGYLPPMSVHTAYATADIFCALSRSEALGNVFLEAGAAGCAIIGTQVGGIPDIVADQKTGLLVPAGDHQAAANALRLLLTDTALRHRLAHAVTKQAEAFDWSVIAKQYRDVYRSCVR